MQFSCMFGKKKKASPFPATLDAVAFVPPKSRSRHGWNQSDWPVPFETAKAGTPNKNKMEVAESKVTGRQSAVQSRRVVSIH